MKPMQTTPTHRGAPPTPSGTPRTATRLGTLLLAASAISGVLIVSPVGAPWTGGAEALTAAETSSSAGTDGATTPVPESDPDTTPDTIPSTPPGADSGHEQPATRRPREGSRWTRIIVDLSEQELIVLNQHGKVLHTWEISSGSPKTPTPVGRYRVTSKSRRTFATMNPDVTMEHMVRFKGGIGFHSIPRRNGTPLTTPLGERGVSHGCIRIADVNARLLYRNLPIGAEVIVKP
jgi:lipoprotein-anchoring transpeptidase ErfK/SrfK